MKRWATFLLIVLTLAIASNGFGQTALKSFTGLQGRELRLYVTNAIDSLTATQTGSCGSFYLYVLGDTVMFAQLADSAKRIDTTYAPFQSYVFNHAGAGSGDIDAVIAGDGMTGGATSGNATLNIVGRFGIISGADSLILDTAGIRTWLTTLADATASDSFFVKYGSWGVEGFLYTGDTLFIDTAGSVSDSVLYADSAGYADTAGYALNSGSTDSFYVAKSDTTVIGWKQSGDTIFVDTTGGVGGGMSIDSTTAGDGLLETANDIDVVPGFGVLIRGDSVHADVAELDDSLMRIGTIIDSTTAGNGLIESANVLAVRPGFGIDTTNDLVLVDFTDLDDTLPRYAHIRDTTALMIEDSLDNYVLTSGLSTYATKANIHDSLVADTGVFLVSFNRLKDTAAAVRVDIRDTVNIMGITDSSAAGTGLTETGNTINAIGRIYILAGADSLALDTAGLRTWAASLIVDSANGGAARSELSDSTNGGAARAELADSTQGGAARAELADSTTGGAARAELADSAKAVDTSYAPLRALKSHIDSLWTVDSLRVTEGELEDSLDGYTLTGHTHDSTGIVDSSISGKDVKRATLALSHMGASGAGVNQVPVFNGTIWEPGAQAALGNNPSIYGDLNLYGNLRNANFKRTFDTTYAYAKRADTFLNIRVPELYIGGADSNLEKYRTAHPSVVYMPGGFLHTGYRYIMANTMDIASQESPFIRVSNDGDNWSLYTIIDYITHDSTWNEGLERWDHTYDTVYASTPDPIADTLDCARAGGYAWYLSDPDLLFGADGKLWLYFRATDTINLSGDTNDSTFQSIWATSTTDLLTWTTPVAVLDWHASMEAAMWMSPAVWVDTASSYKMWVIDDSGSSYARIMLFEAPKADSGWVFVDTVLQGTTGTNWPGAYEIRTSGMGTSLNEARHLDVIDNGADEKIVLMNVYGSGAHVGKTLDGGRSVDMRQEPFLYPYYGGSTGTYLDSAWDATGMYRPTGVIADRNGERVMEVFYGAYRQAIYHTGRTTLWEMKPAILEFNTVAGRRKAPTDSMTLTFPAWSDSSNGRIELLVDSTNQGSDTTRIKIGALTSGIFVADTLVIVYKTTVAGTGSTTTANVRIDELGIYGPDFSSSSMKPDSLWWNSTTDRAIDTVQTLRINIKDRSSGSDWDGAFPLHWESGTQITLWIKASLASDEAALHIERAYIAGRRR